MSVEFCDWGGILLNLIWKYDKLNQSGVAKQ